MAATVGPDDGARPLSDEDLRILALEGDVVAGHTCKVLLLERPVDVDALRERVASRMDAAPDLRLRLEEIAGAPWWVPAPDVRLSDHIVEHSGEELDRDALRARVGSIFEERLERSRPLWQIDLLPRLRGGGGALVWRIHHALADGTTAMRIGRTALWDERSPPTPRSARPARSGGGGRWHPAGLHALVHEAPHPWRGSPFAGTIAVRRDVAFAHADLAALRRAASVICGATVNDAVLTVVSGGIRRWLESHHCRQGAVRVKVPVSLHGASNEGHSGGVEPGNRDSYFCLDLPLGPVEPAARLQAIHRATRERKRDHDAERLEHFMHALGRTSPRLQRFAEQVMAGPRAFALNVSNVPGPPVPIEVLGSRVGAFYSLAEIARRHALRIAVVSLDGALGFGLCADPSVLPDVKHLAAALEHEAQALEDCVAVV